MRDRTSEFETFKKGDRVQVHPATSEWMQGARYGTVMRLTEPRECMEYSSDERYLCRMVYVQMDKLPKQRRFHPYNLLRVAG